MQDDVDDWNHEVQQLRAVFFNGYEARKKCAVYGNKRKETKVMAVSFWAASVQVNNMNFCSWTDIPTGWLKQIFVDDKFPRKRRKSSMIRFKVSAFRDFKADTHRIAVASATKIGW